MTAGIGSGLEFFRQVLALRGYRQQILAADLANASTPGFKAADLDFGQALAAAGSEPGSRPAAGPMWLVDDARQMQPGGASAPTPAAAAASVKYQVGNPVTLDGNSVDINQEKVAAAENALQYEAAATFASQMVKMMMTAIVGTGQNPSGG